MERKIKLGCCWSKIMIYTHNSSPWRNGGVGTWKFNAWKARNYDAISWNPYPGHVRYSHFGVVDPNFSPPSGNPNFTYGEGITVKVLLDWTKKAFKMPKKALDSRIPTLIRNTVQSRHRSFFIIVGDKARDQVVHLHHILSLSRVSARPKVSCRPV